MRAASNTNQLTFQFSDVQTDRKKKQTRPAGRSRDSEGRFVVEVQIPTPEVFKETQERREKSLARMLRIKDEEIERLKAELAKYK